jgi:hypothetical protein
VPLLSTLAADAPPEFREVAGVLVAAMLEHHIPGAALGQFPGGREKQVSFGLASLS